MLDAFGAAAVSAGTAPFVAAFALGCAASSAYGFLAGGWPFGVVEALWAALAARRAL
jgi:hypothetical protein